MHVKHVDMYTYRKKLRENCIRGTCGTQTQTQDAPATLPSAASPSLSMEPSAMGPNRGAAALCKPIAGIRRPGALWMHWVLLFGALKWHPSENGEMDRAPLLGSCCSIGQCNNRPNDDVSGGGGVEEEIRLGATRRGGRLLVV